MAEAVIGDVTRTLQVERGNVIETRKPLEDRVGDLAAGVKPGQLPLLHEDNHVVPVARPSRDLPFAVGIGGEDRDGLGSYRGLAWWHGRGVTRQRFPIFKSLRTRNEELRLGKRDVVVVGILRLLGLAEIEPDVAAHGRPRPHVAEVVPHDPHRRRVAGRVRRHERVSDALVPSQRVARREPMFQRRPAGQTVLARERQLDVGEGRRLWHIGQRALEARARIGDIRSQRFQPALGFFSQVVEGGAGRELSRHGTFLP